ncbi:MAG: hypothetical protein ACOCYE_11225 [Pseudomonadota bacterium]
MHELNRPNTAVAVLIAHVRIHEDAPIRRIDPAACSGDNPSVTSGANRMIDNGEVV